LPLIPPKAMEKAPALAKDGPATEAVEENLSRGTPLEGLQLISYSKAPPKFLRHC